MRYFLAVALAISALSYISPAQAELCGAPPLNIAHPQPINISADPRLFNSWYGANGWSREPGAPNGPACAALVLDKNNTGMPIAYYWGATHDDAGNAVRNPGSYAYRGQFDGTKFSFGGVGRALLFRFELVDDNTLAGMALSRDNGGNERVVARITMKRQ